MRVTVFVVILSLTMSLSAQGAEADDAVMEKYAAYNDAVAAGKDWRARRLAKEAYELAEEAWGESRRETAFLAANYADELTNNENWRQAIGLYERCIEILLKHEGSLEQSTYCAAGIADAQRNTGDFEKARAAYKEIISVVVPLWESQNWAALEAGKAYLGLALLPVRVAGDRSPPRGTISSGQTGSRIPQKEERSDFDPSGKALAEKAIYYFEHVDDQPGRLLAQAHRLAGNYAEAEEDYESAEAHYQAGLEILRALLGEEHRDTIAMEGRIASVQRFTIFATDEPEPTRQPSSSSCAVVVRGDLEIEVCRDKRYPPYFPNQALYAGQQGFSIASYDINQEGRTENARIVHSWPGGIFDERTLKAVEKWTYFPPTDQYGNVVRVTDYQTQITYEIGR